MSKSLTFQSRFLYLLSQAQQISPTAAYAFSTNAKLLSEEQMLACVDYFMATQDMGTVLHDVRGLAREDKFFDPKIEALR